MRVSFVPDTLTFSRKHSCLHSCSLGRDTHYSPFLPFVPRPPAVPPSSPLASTIFPPLDAIRTLLNARMHAHTHVSTCVHIPGETLKCAAVRANTHACLEPRRWTTPSRFLSLALFSLSSRLPVLSLPAALSPAALPLTHSARVRTLRDVRVCQWNTLSLSESQRERERGWGGGREESAVERCRVTVVVGLTLVVENGSVGGYSWHIGAARRPLTFPCLSISISLFLSLSFALCIVLSATRHLSPSHLSVPPFSLTHPASLSACRWYPLRLVPPRRSLLAHERTRDRLRAQESTPLPTPSTLLYVSARLVSIPPASVPSDPLDAGIPSDHPPRCFVLFFVSPGRDSLSDRKSVV